MEMNVESIETNYVKQIKIWHIVGAFVIFAVGALWHFMFEFLNYWEPIGWFFPVNESVWEHVKLMFWPALLYYAVEAIFMWKKTNNFLLAKTTAFYFTPIANIMIFYTYTGITGWESFIFDSVILFITIGIQQYISYKLVTHEPIGEKRKILWIVLLSLAIVLLAVLLIVFTYKPIEIPLLQDSNSGLYGIVEHSH
ncbi:MAG: hypothetical protein FK734_16035 [Asgard group archaeon]|nr:hypothetical protein [Asgard group archaeon]